MRKSAGAAPPSKAARGAGDGGATAGLVERARGGDSAAAAALLDQYLPLLRRTVLYYGRLADVEDLLQQGRVIFLEMLGEFDPARRVPFGAYLKEKLPWRLHHYMRDTLGRRHREGSLDILPPNTIQHLLIADAVAPDRLDWQALERAILGLTSKQRLVLSLFYWDDLSVRQIAERLGETPQGVRQLRGRAERHLRQAMLGEDGTRSRGRPRRSGRGAHAPAGVSFSGSRRISIGGRDSDPDGQGVIRMKADKPGSKKPAPAPSHPTGPAPKTPPSR